MTRLLLLAHSPLASALRDVAGHVYPECASAIEAIDVPPSATVEEVQSSLRRTLATTADEVLLLVDAFGATPCNAAMQVADGVRVRVVTGVNVPMLWRTLCYRNESLDRLVDRAVTGAAQGVMQLALPRRLNQSPAVGSCANDQVDHHHQQ